MNRHMIIASCIVHLGLLYPMNQQNQHTVVSTNHQQKTILSIPFDDISIILLFAVDLPHEDQSNNNASLIMHLIKSILTLRSTCKHFAQGIDTAMVTYVLQQVPRAAMILSHGPSFARYLYAAARDNVPFGVNIILSLSPNDTVRRQEINHPFENTRSRTPALIAAHRSNREPMMLMMPYTDFALRDFYGLNGAMLASHEGHWQMMQLIFSTGAIDTSEEDNIHRDISVYTQTPKTRRVLQEYRTITTVLSHLPRAVIALIYAYFIDQIRIKPARMMGCSKL